jgi:hypothetical protein
MDLPRVEKRRVHTPIRAGFGQTTSRRAPTTVPATVRSAAAVGVLQPVNKGVEAKSGHRFFPERRIFREPPAVIRRQPTDVLYL